MQLPRLDMIKIICVVILAGYFDLALCEATQKNSSMATMSSPSSRTLRASSTSSASISVRRLRSIKKPQINPFLFGSDLQEGMRTTVVCSVISAEPPLTFQWLKDGRPLLAAVPDAETVRYGEFTSSLTLTNLERRHAGNYSCRVSNSNSPHVQATFSAAMVVLAPPKWMIRPKSKYSVLRGHRVIIDCQAEGIPAPIHQWKKRLRPSKSGADGLSGPNLDAVPNEFAVIASGPHAHVFENGSLAIVDAVPTDGGEYTCESNNGVGNSIYVSTLLEVNTAAHFLKNFQLIKVQRGQRAELSCEPLGDPPLSISWFRDRIPLNPDKFLREDTTVDGSFVSRIFLQVADIADSGIFTCHASNSYGSAEKSIQLVVQGPPEPPFGIKAEDVKSREVTISWSEPRNGNSPLIGYFVEYALSSANWNRGSLDAVAVSPKDTQAKLTGLQPDTFYKMRVIAQNALSNSVPSPDYHFQTDMEAPSEVPNHVRIEPLSATMIKISWRSPHSQSTKHPQRIDGYYIGYRETHELHLPGSGAGHDGGTGPLTGYTFKAVELSSALAQSATLERNRKKLTQSSASVTGVNGGITGSNSILNSNGDELELVIQNLKRNTRYGMVVLAYNKKGSGPSSEEIVAQTFEFDRPGPVAMRVMSSTKTSITITWTEPDHGLHESERTPIGGYVISIKSEGSDWIEHSIPGYHSSYVVDSLSCGTKYYLSVCPFNKAGRAQTSEPLEASTQGSPPRAPSLTALLASNSTFALLRLSSWIEQQCPISHFVVKYRVHQQSDWILLSNNIIPEQGQIILSDLIPATWYDIIMTANSEPGPTEAVYRFATLTMDGATIPPPSAIVYTGWELLFSDPLVLVPVLCTVVIALVIVTLVAVVAHRSCINDSVANQANVACPDYIGPARPGDNLNISTTFSAKNEALLDCYHYSMGALPTTTAHFLVAGTNPDNVYDIPLRQAAGQEQSLQLLNSPVAFLQKESCNSVATADF